MRRVTLFCLAFGLVLSSAASFAKDIRAKVLRYCGTQYGDDTRYELLCKAAVNTKDYFEKSVYDLCNQTESADVEIACFAAGAGRTNKIATAVCRKMPEWDLKIDCLKSIAHKKLEKTEITDCDRHRYAEDTISCFQNAGTKIK